jgi:hypothetical protein
MKNDRLYGLLKSSVRVPKGRLNVAQDAVLGKFEDMIQSRRDG